MPITSHTGPAGARAAMEEALSSRRARSRVGRAALSAVPKAGSPIPVYHLSLDDLAADADALARAIRSCWRYPIVGGAEPGLADVRANRDSGVRFGGLLQGVVVQRLLQASELAETALASDAELYEPRLLEVPGVQFCALWLHAATAERFVSLLDGKPPGSAELRVVDDVLGELRRRAVGRTRRVRQAPGAAPTPPSN